MAEKRPRKSVIRDHACRACSARESATVRPPGWKATPEGLLCDACFDARYVLRAVCLPVAEMVGGTWNALYARLHPAWRAATELANWVAAEMFRHDVSYVVPSAKLPKFSKDWYGYGHVVASYPALGDWAGCKSSMGIVVRSAERKYRKDRFAVLVRRDQGLVTWRYPAPWPVDADSWTAVHGANKAPLVTLPLLGGPPVTLRLTRKADLGRQIAAFDAIVAGRAVKGEAALYRSRDDLMLKLVAYLPRAPLKGTRDNLCLLTTDQNALLVADVFRPGVDVQRLAALSPEERTREVELARCCRTWIINHDQLRRWLADRRSYRQRTSEELKREKRIDAEMRRNLLAAREHRLRKARDRIDTALEEASAQVAGFCERQNIGTVVYDDACRAFCEKMPWFSLKSMLCRKLGERGIELVCRDE